MTSPPFFFENYFENFNLLRSPLPPFIVKLHFDLMVRFVASALKMKTKGSYGKLFVSRNLISKVFLDASSSLK